jgi:LCP family protein required for cell wall assembly
MSNFKTKKIHNTPVKKIENPTETISDPGNTKKKTRKYIAIFLVILTCIFGINYVAQWIGGLKLWTAWDDSNWTPPVFEAIGNALTATPIKKWTTNILIVGIGWAGHQAGNLADSIMLASLDEAKNSVTMISIPRDLYVSYGTGNGAWKINTLYPIGLSQKEWITPLANKVSEITGQSIQHYIVVDFTAFRYVVNALGWVEVDVANDIYDAEYPDYNYGYTIFSLKKWLQNLNGETALRYARSRHSTSDMDRSRRQQQLISAIKSKALSAWVLTSPTKISDIIEATRSNINTDLTVSDIISIGANFANADKSDIHIYNLGNNCVSYTNCTIGSYLYNPSMAYFGWAWSLIPEWAKINRLSYYDRIREFVNFVFHFPGINTTEQPIVMVAGKSNQAYAKNLLMEMKKIGINYDENNAFKTATGEIERSYINVYWNEEFKVWINPESEIIQALKMLDMRIPVNIVTKNEFVTNDGPKIEIVLGKDYKNFFIFSKPVEYLPKIETPSISGSTLSWEKKQNNTTPAAVASPKKNTNSKEVVPEKTNNSPYKIMPGEWEEL